MIKLSLDDIQTTELCNMNYHNVIYVILHTLVTNNIACYCFTNISEKVHARDISSNIRSYFYWDL
jgi:hypothetical protein